MSELPNSCGAAVRLLGRTLCAGDKRAFEALVDAHHCALVALALTYVRSHEVADEIVQETWVAVLAGIDRFRGRSSLKTWILRILVSTAITRGGREARVIPFSTLARACRFDKLISYALSVRDDPRHVIADPEAHYFGTKLADDSLLPGKNAQLAETRFEDWLGSLATHRPTSPPLSHGGFR